MQDIAYLTSAKIGGDSESLKKKLQGPIKDKQVAALVETHQQRILSSITRNFTDSKLYWSLDRIIDSAQRNLPFVQARELLSKSTHLEAEKVVASFQQWGLDQMLVKKTGPNGEEIFTMGKPVLEINMDLFDKTYVPLVASYRTMRWASLFNQRNSYPLYKYSPTSGSTKHLAQTEVITSAISRMSSDMGHLDDTKQCILSMLDYGMALRLPSSAWHREEYDTMSGGKKVTLTQREGVKSIIPRPERTFMDMSHPLTTINSDTGCSWYGYWDMVKYGTVKRNKKFWNTDRVNFGSATTLFRSPGWGYMGEFFPCQLKVPICPDGFDENNFDRLDKAFWYSNTSEEDSACPLTVMFDKITPSEWNLFNYDKPVWTRWVYADTATPLFCEVLPYSPGACYLYDYDSNRAFQNSLTLLLSPFQQMFGNYLTQYYISVRNNLPRITFYNTDIIEKDHIARMSANKATLYQGLTFLPFSKRERAFSQQDKDDAFHNVTFPQTNTSEIQAAMRTTLDVLERMLGFPSQEVGQPAAHEQTAKEILVISGHGQTRADFDGDGVDAAEKAVKRMLYDAWVNYGSDTVTATVVGVSPEKKAALKEMGFEVEDGESNKNNTFGVKGPKSALTLANFSTDQEGNTRAQDPKVAISMMQALGVALQNPTLFQALGAEQVCQLINDVFVWAGMPDDFRLKVSEEYKTPEDQQEEFIKGLEDAKGEILKASMEQLGKAMKNIADGIKKQVIEPTQVRFRQIDETNQQQDQILHKLVETIGRALNAIPPEASLPSGADPRSVVPMNGNGAIPGNSNFAGAAAPGPGIVAVPPGVQGVPELPEGAGG